MLRFGIAMFAFAVSALVLNSVIAQSGGSVKSGPQVGQELPGPFHPLNVTGENKGKKHCLYCENGGNPVAVVFAREATPEVAKLLAQLDEATNKNSKAKMGSFAVFCNDKDGLDKTLVKLASDKKLTKLVLSIDNPGGPEKYNISKDAEVTVLLYYDRKVEANHSFKKGDLNDAAITKIVADVSKIVK
jgi:hypothetical protein